MQSVRKVTYAYDHVGRNVMKDGARYIWDDYNIGTMKGHTLRDFGWKKKKQKDEDNHKKENSIFDSNVVKVPTELVKTTMPEGALDVIKMSTMSAAVTAAKSVVQGAEAVPGVVAVKSARGGISQIENLADPSGATLSSEDGMKALENLEQSIRSSLRNFNNLK